MDFTKLSGEELTAAVSALSDADLATHSTEFRTKLTAALSKPVEEATVADVTAAEEFNTVFGAMNTETKSRAATVKAASESYATMKASLEAPDEEAADEPVEEPTDEDPAEEPTDDPAEEVVEVEAAADPEEDPAAKDKKKEEEAMTAAARAASQKLHPVNAAKAVGQRAKRPVVPVTAPVTITAAADVPQFAAGSEIGSLEQVTTALINRSKGFPKQNMQAAQRLQAAGQIEAIHKFGVASFGINFDKTMVASAGKDYSAVRNAINGRDPLTAAGWCAPSETIYSWIADFIVDGIKQVPEVSAPRGGLNITTGPAHNTQGQALDDFGFVQTEAQAIAREVKPCETIECPDFEEVRLDAIGYCIKIPILTQKAYPELITDALKLASTVYAHKVNKRTIGQLVAMSDTVTFDGYGPSMTDTLEALTILATRERRRWNLGQNAVMEVTLPVWVREVFRADMSRRTGLALSDPATDQRIDQEFSIRKLAVEYVNDWQELANGPVITTPDTYTAMIYPKGTFVRAVEDVINLSTVYDAASLSVNEYTGVFFEQGMLTAQVGYGSSLLTLPVNTAGETGAADLFGPRGGSI